MRRKQADLRFNKAVEMGAPSRLQGPPPATRAPILEKLRSDGTTERVEDLQGRTDIVHNHFKELFTDPLHKETPEWIWQRWPREVLREVPQSLPTIDSQRVREAAYAFRKRTSCADDHLVIEMLRELDDDMWETLAKCFHCRLLNHWTEGGHAVSWLHGCQTAMRGFRPNCNAPDDVPFVFKDLQQLVGQAIHTRRSPQYGHVPGRQAHEVVFILRRMVEQATEWQIPIFVMDCDVAAAFDHVSHHVIIDAMEALKVPPVVVAAWIREYRESETLSSWTTS